MSYEPQEPLVLVAGAGRLPLVAARSHRAGGGRLHLVSLSRQITPELEELTTEAVVFSIGQVGGILDYALGTGARQVSLLGKVVKGKLFDGLKLDALAMKLWLATRDRSDRGIIRTLCDLAGERGLEVVSQLDLLRELVTPEGALTKKRPGPAEEEDAHLAFRLALECSRLGIGQTVLVRGGIVVAVEALEGSDRCLVRAGELSRGGSRLFKGGLVMAKAAGWDHDVRSDVPTVGTDTLAKAKEAGVTCIALESGRTLIADGVEEFARTAAKLGIAVLGVPLHDA
ncbi:MAG TPA: UDP-2,3-diacylglucosamine diphosphatase LpxI [bacterium]|nr:UDP-2,3-diacylglucosamine diphosphatase LpxI [bacterium]